MCLTVDGPQTQLDLSDVAACASANPGATTAHPVTDTGGRRRGRGEAVEAPGVEQGQLQPVEDATAMFRPALGRPARDVGVDDRRRALLELGGRRLRRAASR